MSIKSKIKSFFSLDEEFLEDELEAEYEQLPAKPPRSERKNVVNLQSVQKTAKLILFEPRMYAEAQHIADHLKNRRAVVVNLQRLDHDQARRVVDFLSGTVYAIGGDIQRIGDHIFICAPENVEISGNVSDYLVHDENLHKGL
jgi:cell division inhibitor SepF